MPALTDTGAGGELKVAASAPFELMWLMHNCEAGHELIGPYASQEPIRRQLGDRCKAFWADGVRGSTDVVVLAGRSGTLWDLDLDRFFERFDAACADVPVPSMLSETPLERRAYGERLHRLQSDPDLRIGYRELLQSVWTAARDEWEGEGRAAVLATAEQWSRQLGSGAGYEDVKQLIERQQVWKGRPQYDTMAQEALGDGRLALSPGWFFGEVHLVELDGAVYLGHGIRPPDVSEKQRRVAEHVSYALKSLADPTRLSILLWVAREPSSVTELARHFKLSQPTVSGHVQVLREAGLLEEKVSGRSARLSTNEDTVRRFFGVVQDEIVRQVH